MSKEKPEGYIFGRPTAYKKEYCEMLKQHCAKGFTFESFAGKVGVCRDTLYEWTRANKDFSYAKKQAKEINRQTLEAMGLNLMSGRVKGNPAVWIFFMKNLHGWKDDPFVEDEIIDGIEFVDE